ncbi:MAG: tyrosine decarboxylase MfnA [Promethearchaeota archaeon]
MFKEQGLPKNQVLELLSQTLELDSTYTSGYPVSSMSTTPHQLGVEIFSRTMDRNAGRYNTFRGCEQIEHETISMIGDLLRIHQPYGTSTSGGTESNVLAMLAARETSSRSIQRPTIIAPETVHSSVEKAAWILGLNLIKTKVDDKFRAIPEEIEQAITPDTIGILCTAGTTYLGQVDPIPKIASIADAHQLPLHVDAAFGGFVLPFLNALGYPSPSFDFQSPGVTSISMDPHKMGLAPIPASFLLFRNQEPLQKITMNVPYLLGASANQRSLLGTRPAGPILATWGIMKHLGRKGYQNIIKTCMNNTMLAMDRIAVHPKLSVPIPPIMNLLAIQIEGRPLQKIAEVMGHKGWRMALSPIPPTIRMVVMPHLKPATIKAFFDQLIQELN